VSDDRNTEEAEPFKNTVAADFVETEEATYALIGSLVEHTDDSGARAYYLMTHGSHGNQMTEQVLPLFHWFSTPRSESQVAAWLAWADSPRDTMKALIKRGLIVRIDPSSSWKAAKSLRGLRLVPLSLPDLDTPVSEGLMAMKRTPESRCDAIINVELGQVIAGDVSGADIPEAVAALAKRDKDDREDISRLVLTDIPFLLEHGLARLEHSHAR
jgi:hypothetical protein